MKLAVVAVELNNLAVVAVDIVNSAIVEVVIAVIAAVVSKVLAHLLMYFQNFLEYTDIYSKDRRRIDNKQYYWHLA